MKVDFAPVRWWQAISFIRLNFKLVQDSDPLAARISSQPWALSSLLEYGYMLGTFFRSNAYFIAVSGERAGATWLACRSGISFALSVGMLPRFQRSGIGAQTITFIENLAKRQGCDALAGTVAVGNEPMHQLIKSAGYHALGLATTKLTLSTNSLSPLPSTEIEIRRMGKSKAVKAWKHWKLYEVEHVAGRDGTDVAARLLDSDLLQPLPWGKYLALYQDDQKIGFTYARRRQDRLELGLFPSTAFWTGTETAKLVATISADLESPVHELVLTQTHANALAESAPFGFERHRERERIYSFRYI